MTERAPWRHDFTLGFTTVYIFIGIPLYASVMGFVADVYISSYQRRQARRQVRARRLSHSHFDRMLALRSATGTDHVTKSPRLSVAHQTPPLQDYDSVAGSRTASAKRLAVSAAVSRAASAFLTNSSSASASASHSSRPRVSSMSPRASSMALAEL